MGDYAFGSSIFGTIRLGGSISTIPNRAFYSASFDRVILGSHVSNIYAYAFAYSSVSDGIYFCGDEPRYGTYEFACPITPKVQEALEKGSIQITDEREI